MCHPVHRSAMCHPAQRTAMYHPAHRSMKPVNSSSVLLNEVRFHHTHPRRHGCTSVVIGTVDFFEKQQAACMQSRNIFIISPRNSFISRRDQIFLPPSAAFISFRFGTCALEHLQLFGKSSAHNHVGTAARLWWSPLTSHMTTCLLIRTRGSGAMKYTIWRRRTIVTFYSQKYLYCRRGFVKPKKQFNDIL